MSAARALLLTDVVDSTKLSEELGDAAMAELWARHDRLARDLLPRWGGREIDKTDGMLLMFGSANDAVGYAHDYHRALTTLPVQLRARAGLHVGPVLVRENSPEDVARGAKPLEVDGLAKPTAARVMSLAVGGQTLLTREARDALGESMALSLASHGHWQMKGINEPVELFAVGDNDATFVTPADGDKGFKVVRYQDHWRPVREVDNNLPEQATSFVGRTREIREIKAALETSRLVTLLGMGGLGKTRLSLRVGSELLGSFPDGVWFLDFAPIRDPELVASEAAQVLDVREEPDRPLVRTLGAALKGRRTLLVFDNCEHLVQSTAELANALLRAAPQLRILASSREALRVPGELAYPVLPLPVPQPTDSLATLAESTAVKLFVDRAYLHRPGFGLTEQDAPAVAELVARLEGIPLALELAAARVRSLNVAEINLRLKDRYKLLTGGGRVLLPRQQTLRALVDWSYELLDEREQAVFNRLAVFAGGFDIAAAEAVCAAEPIEDFEVLDLLASLVDKSLVMTEERDGATRYRMLETIRDYAAEKLERGSEKADTAARHCTHFFGFAKQARDGLKGAEQAQWIRRAEAELDNLRAAIALAGSGAVDPFMVVKFSIAMMAFWMLRGYVKEGRAVLEAALRMPQIQASDLAQAHALYVNAALAGAQHEHAASRQMLERCLELRRKLGNPMEIAAALSTLSLARLQGGDVEAAAASETEALALFRSLGETLGEAISLLHLGEIAVYGGDAAAARDHLDAGLRIARSIGNREVEGEAELALGELAFEYGRAGEARAHLERSLEVCQEAGDKRGEAQAQWWLGRADLDTGRLDEACTRLSAALVVFRDFEMREPLAECLEDHALLALAQDEPMVAVRLAGAAQAYRSRFDLPRSAYRERLWLAREVALHHAVPAPVFAEAWGAGQELDVDDAVKLAQGHAQLADVETAAAHAAQTAQAAVR